MATKNKDYDFHQSGGENFTSQSSSSGKKDGDKKLSVGQKLDLLRKEAVAIDAVVSTLRYETNEEKFGQDIDRAIFRLKALYEEVVQYKPRGKTGSLKKEIDSLIQKTELKVKQAKTEWEKSNSQQLIDKATNKNVDGGYEASRKRQINQLHAETAKLNKQLDGIVEKMNRAAASSKKENPSRRGPQLVREDKGYVSLKTATGKSVSFSKDSAKLRTQYRGQSDQQIADTLIKEISHLTPEEQAHIVSLFFDTRAWDPENKKYYETGKFQKSGAVYEKLRTGLIESGIVEKLAERSRKQSIQAQYNDYWDYLNVYATQNAKYASKNTPAVKTQAGNFYVKAKWGRGGRYGDVEELAGDGSASEAWRSKKPPTAEEQRAIDIFEAEEEARQQEWYKNKERKQVAQLDFQTEAEMLASRMIRITDLHKRIQSYLREHRGELGVDPNNEKEVVDFLQRVNPELLKDYEYSKKLWEEWETSDERKSLKNQPPEAIKRKHFDWLMGKIKTATPASSTAEMMNLQKTEHEIFEHAPQYLETATYKKFSPALIGYNTPYRDFATGQLLLSGHGLTPERFEDAGTATTVDLSGVRERYKENVEKSLIGFENYGNIDFLKKYLELMLENISEDKIPQDVKQDIKNFGEDIENVFSDMPDELKTTVRVIVKNLLTDFVKTAKGQSRQQQIENSKNDDLQLVMAIENARKGADPEDFEMDSQTRYKDRMYAKEFGKGWPFPFYYPNQKAITASSYRRVHIADAEGNKQWTDTLINDKSIVGKALDWWDPDDLWQQILGFNKEDMVPVFLEILRSFFVKKNGEYQKKGNTADEIRKRLIEGGFTDKSYLSKALGQLGFDERSLPFSFEDGELKETQNLRALFWEMVTKISPFRNEAGEIVDYQNKPLTDEELEKEFSEFDKRMAAQKSAKKAFVDPIATFKKAFVDPDFNITPPYNGAGGRGTVPPAVLSDLLNEVKDINKNTKPIGTMQRSVGTIKTKVSNIEKNMNAVVTAPVGGGSIPSQTTVSAAATAASAATSAATSAAVTAARKANGTVTQQIGRVFGSNFPNMKGFIEAVGASGPYSEDKLIQMYGKGNYSNFKNILGGTLSGEIVHGVKEAMIDFKNADFDFAPDEKIPETFEEMQTWVHQKATERKGANRKKAVALLNKWRSPKNVKTGEVGIENAIAEYEDFLKATSQSEEEYIKQSEWMKKKLYSGGRSFAASALSRAGVGGSVVSEGRLAGEYNGSITEGRYDTLVVGGKNAEIQDIKVRSSTDLNEKDAIQPIIYAYYLQKAQEWMKDQGGKITKKQLVENYLPFKKARFTEDDIDDTTFGLLQKGKISLSSAIQYFNRDTGEFATYRAENLGEVFGKFADILDKIIGQGSLTGEGIITDEDRIKIAGVYKKSSDINETGIDPEIAAQLEAQRLAAEQQKQEEADLKEYNRLLKEQYTLKAKIADINRRLGLATTGVERDSLQKLLGVATEQEAETATAVGRIGSKITSVAGLTKKSQYDREAEAAFRLKEAEIGTKNRGARTIWDVMGRNIQQTFMRFFDFRLVNTALMKLQQRLRQTVQTMQQLDKAATNIRIVSGMNAEEVNNLMISYNKLARELGTTTQAVAESSNTWLRQGYDINATSKLIKASTELSKLGMLDMNASTKVLTSTLKGFKMEASEATSVVDKLTKLDTKFAASAGEIGEAISRTAALAQQANVSLDETAAIVTTIMDVTQQSAEMAGTALRTILSRYGNVKAGAFVNMDEEDTENLNDIEKVLGQIGIRIRSSASDMRAFDDVLDDLNEKWVSLTDVEKNAIATAMAGKRVPEYMETYI